MTSTDDTPIQRRQCTATVRRTGNRCQRSPIKGGEVCLMHGGRAPQVKAAAAKRLAHAQAEKAVQTYGLSREIGPEEALLEEVHWTAGHVAWLRQVVAELEQKELRQYVPTGERGGKWDVSVWVELYQRERTHLVGVCKAAIAAGIAERAVKLAERQAEMLVTVIMAMIDDPELGLDGTGRVLARRVAARHLRILEPSG